MKKIIFGGIIVVLGILLFFITQVHATKLDKLTVCHKTHSEKNPWVEQTIKANELQSHLDNGDFLVDESHSCPPSVDLTASPTPSEVPLPTNFPCFIWEGEFPVPCPSVTPTVSPDPTEEVTPTPSSTPSTGSTDSVSNTATPPTCGDGNTVKLPANPFVVRKGSQATVNFFITQGDSANIYYRVVGQSNWQYSVLDVTPNGDEFVSVTINKLDPKLGYDFGVQQKFGCGGGQLVTTVIVDGPQEHTFRFSYWEWSK